MGNSEPRKYNTFHEIFEALEATNQFNQKVKILEANDTPVTRAFFVLAYHPAIEWKLPEGEPPYKKNTESPDEKGYFNMVKNMSQFNIYLKGRGYDNMKQPIVEKRFIQMLEGVTQLEASWIIQAKDGELVKCSEKVIRKAFGGLLPDATK